MPPLLLSLLLAAVIVLVPPSPPPTATAFTLDWTSFTCGCNDPECDATTQTCRCGTKSCNYQKCCTRRRRLLLVEMQCSWGRPLQEGSNEYLAYLDQCGDEPYETFLHVGDDSHLFAIMTPVNTNTATTTTTTANHDCPHFAGHTNFNPHIKRHQKEILVWNDKNDFNKVFHQEGSYAVGTFKLSELAHAYEETQPSDAVVYDVITNNCGIFLIKLANKMGIQIDSKLTSFVIRRLVEVAGKEFYNQIKSSLSYWSLFDDENYRHLRGDEISSEELVELVVEKSVQHEAVA